MNAHDYLSMETEIVNGSLDISRRKRPAYTGENADVLFNFKKSAEAAGITPEQAWIVLAHKHWDALVSAAKSSHIHQEEPLVGRAQDAINYIILLLGLLHDSGRIEFQFIRDDPHKEQATTPLPLDFNRS